MSYLLDTCIISKLRKIKIQDRDTSLQSWVLSHSETNYYLSALTIGEVQAGISKLRTDDPQEARKRIVFEDWLLGELIPRFEGRILSFDAHTASIWGALRGDALKQGVNLPVIDSCIAATAIQHNFILVTENIKDFKHMNIRLINPLEAVKNPV